MLDELRRVGQPLLCAWGAWAYQVVVAAFEAQSAGPWWVPYRVRLLVLYDASRPPVAPDLALDGVNDLAQAEALGASAVVNVDGALATAAVGLTGDPGTAIMAASDLAQLAAARGYLARAGA